MADEQPRERHFNIQTSPEIMAGHYANFANVSHSDYEFTITFARVDHEVEEEEVPGVVVTRVSLAPRFMRELIDAMTDNYQRWQTREGTRDARRIQLDRWRRGAAPSDRLRAGRLGQRGLLRSRSHASARTHAAAVRQVFLALLPDLLRGRLHDRRLALLRLGHLHAVVLEALLEALERLGVGPAAPALEERGAVGVAALARRVVAAPAAGQRDHGHQGDRQRRPHAVASAGSRRPSLIRTSRGARSAIAWS
jgi:hypothetical protein